jgi:hypothetical protein
MEPVQLYLRAWRRRTRDPYYYWHGGTRFEQENRHVAEVRYIVQVARRLGWLKRQPCEVCGDPSTDAHHENYAKPLAVRWLCRTHHRRRDCELRRLGRKKGAA